ncbi:major facilitator family transporter [Nitzschia inconspicua]|uniref:Major facilitator family transporter n=1 Tax=Nitzschia inconspicua TaxID=303405 RepID=A0A9K3PSY4_9STRA|nr:major facilitator family transporter [Nitzschia inconspicua]
MKHLLHIQCQCLCLLAIRRCFIAGFYTPTTISSREHLSIPRADRYGHNQIGKSLPKLVRSCKTECFGSLKDDHSNVVEKVKQSHDTSKYKDSLLNGTILVAGSTSASATSSRQFNPSFETENGNEKTSMEQGVVTMMVLLFLVGSLFSLDRVAMSVALVPMSQEITLTDTIKGSISSFFSVGYGLGIVPAGLILSQPMFSPRRIMAGGIALWSIGTIATPLLIDDMTLLLAARMLVGMSESVVIPTVQRLLSAWVPLDKKSVAVAVIFCGFQTGTILAYAISPDVIDAFYGNWRSIFFVYGGAGLLFLVPWWLLAQDSPNATATDVTDSLTENSPDSKQPTSNGVNNIVSAFQSTRRVWQDAPWIDFWQSKAAWAMFLAHAANNWGLYNNLSWTPTFYAEQYGLNVKESAWLLILPSLVGFVGGLSSGSIADALLQMQTAKSEEDIERNTTRIRRIFQGLALLGPAICLATLSINISSCRDTPVMAQSLLAVAVGLQSFNAAGYGAANQEKAGQKFTGLLYAVTSLPSVIVGTLGVQYTGRILDATQQNWSIVFGLNAIVYVVGATAFVLLYNSKQEFE